MKLFKKEDFYLIIIFLAISFAILLNSFFATNGILSPDSAGYLGLAQNIIDGNGYIIPSNRIQPFAVWPIAYPTAIAITSYITGLSVFWSSKLLNIILIGIIFVIIRKYYKEQAYLIALLFTWGSYILIYFYTWSETLFIFAFILFSISIYKFIKSNKHTILNYIFLILYSLLLYFTRYIGALSFGIIGLLGVYYLFFNKKYKVAFNLFIISILGLIIVKLNLFINYSLTGFPTGMPRVISPETNLELLNKLVKALFYELIIPLHSGGTIAIFLFSTQIFLIVIGWKFLGIKCQKFTIKEYLLEKIFFINGVIYLLLIILMRWKFQFDDFNYRLFAPGTILIYIAILGLLIKNKVFIENKFLIVYIVAFSLLSFLINSSYYLYKYRHQPHYVAYINQFKEKLNTIPLQSSIVFPPKELSYLRLDLNLYTPYYLPYFKNKETLKEFKKRINCNNGEKIYIYTGAQEDIKNYDFDQSIINFYEKVTASKPSDSFVEYTCK